MPPICKAAWTRPSTSQARSRRLLILSGVKRWAGALVLAGFTLFATFVANRFWEMVPPERFMAANSFFEHIGLIGGFILVAWHDLKQRQERN